MWLRDTEDQPSTELVEWELGGGPLPVACRGGGDASGGGLCSIGGTTSSPRSVSVSTARPPGSRPSDSIP